MSVASASYSCTWVSNNSTYTLSLQCTTGELLQMYGGDAASPSIPPEHDWSVKKPVIEAVLMCSDPDVSESQLADKLFSVKGATKWYFNGEQILFNSSGVSLNNAGGAQIAGCFKLIEPKDGSHPLGGLQVLKNMVGISSGVNASIKVELAVEEGSSYVVAPASIGMRFIKFVSGLAVAEIYCDSGQTFALDGSHTTVKCKARLWQDGKDAGTGKKLRWFLYDASQNGWVNKAASADGTVTVSREDVNTYQEVMCAFYESDNALPNVKTDGTITADFSDTIATDTQTVADTLDAYILFPNPTPADGTLYASNSSADGVTFAPTVRDKNTNTEVTGMKFKFTCTSPAGVILNGTAAQAGTGNAAFDVNGNGVADNTELLTTYKVPRAMFEQIQAGPTVIITAFKTT